MRVKGMNDVEIEVLMNEGGESAALSLLINNETYPISQLNEYQINLLVKELQSMAEDMRDHRERREFERMHRDGRTWYE